MLKPALKATLCFVVVVATLNFYSCNSGMLAEIVEQDNNAAELAEKERIEKLDLSFTSHQVVSGDTLEKIARDNQLRTDTLISVNEINNARGLRIGQNLQVPNMDGIVHKIKKGETIAAISEHYKLSPDRIVVPKPGRGWKLPGASVFLKQVRMDSKELKRVSGDIFTHPVRSWYLSERFGYRYDPFSGRRSFHRAIDMVTPYGASIRAPRRGTVITASYDNALGNYIQLQHDGGYSTLFAHLSAINVRKGQVVKEGHVIGLVGNSGKSTGTHLHFAVYQRGRPINPLLVLY